MMWRIMQISEDVIHLGQGECPGVDDIFLDLQSYLATSFSNC